MISVKCSEGVIEFTPEELSKEIEDLIFFRDAFLMLLNPEINLSSHTRAEYISLAKDRYIDFGGYPKDIIEEAFKIDSI